MHAKESWVNAIRIKLGNNFFMTGFLSKEPFLSVIFFWGVC